VKRWCRRIFFGLAAVWTFIVGGAYWQIFVAALVLAFGLRLAYVVARRRARKPLVSGWIFVVALALVVTAAAGTHGRRVRRANAAAVRQSVVATTADATPVDRCVGVYLDWWDKDGRKRAPSWTKPEVRVFVRDVCRRAEAERVLGSDGSIADEPLRRIWRQVGEAG
jgi:hypothetical protein